MNTDNKLPEDFKQRWVAALRSGEYKQGKTFLYNKFTDCYCVFGVAGVLLGINKNDLHGNCVADEKLGFPTHISFSNDPVGELVGLNDNGWSFQMIADHIEQNL